MPTLCMRLYTTQSRNIKYAYKQILRKHSNMYAPKVYSKLCVIPIHVLNAKQTM